MHTWMLSTLILLGQFNPTDDLAPTTPDIAGAIQLEPVRVFSETPVGDVLEDLFRDIWSLQEDSARLYVQRIAALRQNRDAALDEMMLVYGHTPKSATAFRIALLHVIGRLQSERAAPFLFLAASDPDLPEKPAPFSGENELGSAYEAELLTRAQAIRALRSCVQTPNGDAIDALSALSKSSAPDPFLKSLASNQLKRLDPDDPCLSIGCDLATDMDTTIRPMSIKEMEEIR